MATPPVGAGGGQPQPDQQQGQQQGEQQGQQGEDSQEPFRQFAKLGMALGQKYPETAQYMAEILKQIKSAMAAVAGNPQRTQETQPPPQA